MKGIVVQQNISYGIVVTDNKNDKQQQLQGMSQNNYGNNLEKIREEPLYSSTGYKKNGLSWAKEQILLLTTHHVFSHDLHKITKLKVKRVGDIPEHRILKLSLGQQDYFYSFLPNYSYHFFYRIIRAKLATMNIFADQKEEFLNSCDGYILKKSEILGNWEPRYMLITAKDGLMSHKTKNEGASLTISQTEQIWTRFELIDGKKYLVFKLWYGLVKQQFGVPLDRAIKWCKALYSLIDRNT